MLGVGLRRRGRAIQKRIDRSLVRGQASIVLWLGGAALAVAVVAALVATLLHLGVSGEDLSFPQAFWQSLVRTIDPGQITEDRAGFAVLGLLVTIGGLLLVSTLISLVNNRIERRVEGIPRGRDPLPDRSDHIVILGWSDIGTKVVEEFAQSGDGKDPVDLVVLGPEPVAQLRHRLMENDKLDGVSSSWPVLRHGSPTDVRDLKNLASVKSAKAVVVLDDGTPSGPANTVRTVMAVVAACGGIGRNEAPVRNGDGHRLDPESVPLTEPRIVVEVADGSGQSAPHLRRRLRPFGFDVLPVCALDLRTEVAAQAARRAGLSAVYSELLDFDGAEIRIVEPADRLETFGDAVAWLSDAVPIGIVDPNKPECTKVDLWPCWTTSLAGRRLVVVAENEAASRQLVDSGTQATWLADYRPKQTARPLEPQNVLVVGWNDGAPQLLETLDSYVGERSSVTVVSERRIPKPRLDLTNFAEPTFKVLNARLQAWLDEQHHSFDHAIVLEDDHGDAVDADARTLVTLLALRPAGRDHGKPATVAAQLRQRENKYVAPDGLADDLIVGDSLVATTLAQLAVAPDLYPILHGHDDACQQCDDGDRRDGLLRESPFTIDLVEVPRLPLGGEATFAELTERAASHGDIALGWVTKTGTVSLAPPKSYKIADADPRWIVVFTAFETRRGRRRNPQDRHREGTLQPV